MRLWTQNGLLLCSQLKFLGTWFLAAVLCCDFCGVRSVATLQLLETPGKVKCPWNIPKNLEKLFLVDVPVMIFVTGPSSQQSPLQSPQLPPKRSDKEVIFGYLSSGKHKNTFALIFLFSLFRTKCEHSPQEVIFFVHANAEAIAPEYGRQTVSQFPENNLKCCQKIKACKNAPGSRDSEELFLHLASSLGPTSAYPPSG